MMTIMDADDPLAWCESHGAWVRWSHGPAGSRMVELAVACGPAETHLVKVAASVLGSPGDLLREAVVRMGSEISAHDRRGSLRLV